MEEVSLPFYDKKKNSSYSRFNIKNTKEIFKNNQKNGAGVCTLKNSRKVKCLWKEDVLIEHERL